MIVEATSANFTKEAIDGAVLVVFSTPHCGPCRMMAPVYPLLENVKVLKVDASVEVEIANAFQVSVVPTLYSIKDGVIKEKMVGRVAQSVLQQKIDALQ